MRLTKCKCATRCKRSTKCEIAAKCLLAVVAVCCSIPLNAFSGFAYAPPGPDHKSGYHVARTISIGGVGRWDYCVVDSDARRVYVSHSTHVVVLDADTGAQVGDIPDTKGVHGIALAPDLGRGFTSNGGANSITIFDLKTLKTISVVPIQGQNPDAIFYDASTRRILTFNGRSNDATVVNAIDGKVLGSLPMGGRPEFAAGDGSGKLFVNIEDKSQLLQIDAARMSVLHRWPLAPCKEPSGLAMDTAHHRLFAVCSNKLMAVVNSETGKVIATPRIDDDPDAAGFDPGTQLVFSSNGESGNLTVIHEDSPAKYSVIENVPTKKYARTLAIDLRNHNIFLPIAEFEAKKEKGTEGPPPMKADSFGVLLVSR